MSSQMVLKHDDWANTIESPFQFYVILELQFRIETLTGRDLSALNNEGSGEILFERDKNFKLVDLKKENCKIVVTLEEMK